MSGSQDEFLTKLQNVETGVVTDALSRLGLSGWMDAVLPLGHAQRIVARATTAKFAPRSGAPSQIGNIYTAIRGATQGSVLIVDSGCTDRWLLGENVAHAAYFQGLAGIISDSMVRDVAQLKAMDFPVFARGISVRPPELEMTGIDVAVECGGAQVHPGDYIVADADGVVVVPQSQIERVMVEIADLEQLEKDQELALAEQAPLEVINELLRRKKTPKGSTAAKA
ncbi:RraA family protein [Nitratireductor rhodophyticola]|uniref:RraA family protein n=1 Tax=Nitratireductor rhodophyticola TaxID=2854036 RepID=UPI00300B8996